jgi:hypothetical protein
MNLAKFRNWEYGHLQDAKRVDWISCPPKSKKSHSLLESGFFE